MLSVGVGEAALRWALFHSRGDIAAKDAAYYARTPDELWIYRFLFSTQQQWALAPGQSGPSTETGIEFYRRWATSLVPDAELGYVRKAGVTTPCHETTNLGSRGTHDHPASGRRLVFFGDSFVESAACSNDTLTTKIEALTGIDTLNFGVGGYGLDQMYLYLKRNVGLCAQDDCVMLVGLIQDDLERILLKGRTGPKPYFTIDGGRLELHTRHIHPDSLNDYFLRPSGRFYLYDFVRGRLGFPVYDAVVRESRDARRERVAATSALLFDRFADLRRRGRFRIAFVLLPTPGMLFDPSIASAIRQRDLPVIDLQRCLTASGRSDTELYAEQHPTSLGNALLARCLVRDLTATGLLR